MRSGLFILFIFINYSLISQIKDFKVIDGDTVNIIDKDSLRQGVWREMYTSGKLKTETVYKNNKKQGLEITWYSGGCVKEERYYNNGMLDGPVTFYDKSCKKESIESFKNGVKDGLEIVYHSNGRIKSEGNFKKGNLDGTYKVYNKNGEFSFESRTTTGPVDFTANFDDTTTSAVFQVIKRNPKWKKTVVVTDMTASMYPYAKEIHTWLKLFFMKDTASQYFAFFNDGDTKRDENKRIGMVGGVYVCRAKNCDDLINTMKITIRKGEGGDSPESVVEPILTALKKVRKPDNIILIADNWAKVRDLNLIARVKVPVRVILCGVFDGMEINTDYLNIAYKTKGSIHTIEQDITDLVTQTSGKKFNINGFDYIIQGRNY